MFDSLGDCLAKAQMNVFARRVTIPYKMLGVTVFNKSTLKDQSNFRII